MVAQRETITVVTRIFLELDSNGLVCDDTRFDKAGFNNTGFNNDDLLIISERVITLLGTNCHLDGMEESTHRTLALFVSATQVYGLSKVEKQIRLKSHLPNASTPR